MKRDSEVEQEVLRSLTLDPAISSREICVTSHCGVVTLSGTVLSDRESSAIEHASRRSPGVCEVVNKIEVRGDRQLIPKHSLTATTPAHSHTAAVTPHPAPDRRPTPPTDRQSKALGTKRRAAKEAVTVSPPNPTQYEQLARSGRPSQ